MKKYFIMIIACLFLVGPVKAESISLWREPAPALKNGKYGSVILDKGKLTKAVHNGNKEYIFSEKGAGVKPLIIIGTPVQIISFLKKHETRGIENHIKDLQDIYMGITNYRSGERFSGLFPLHDVFIRAVESVQKFLPFGDAVTDAGGIPSDLKDLYHKIHKLDDNQKSQDEVLYVKFSYLPEEGMVKIGRKSVSFGKILTLFEQR